MLAFARPVNNGDRTDSSRRHICAKLVTPRSQESRRAHLSKSPSSCPLSNSSFIAQAICEPLSLVCDAATLRRACLITQPGNAYDFRFLTHASDAFSKPSPNRRKTDVFLFGPSYRTLAYERATVRPYICLVGLSVRNLSGSIGNTLQEIRLAA